MSYLWEVVVYWYEAVACKSGAGLPPNGVGRLGETGSDGCGAGRFFAARELEPAGVVVGKHPGHALAGAADPPLQPRAARTAARGGRILHAGGFLSGQSGPRLPHRHLAPLLPDGERPRPAVLCAGPVAGQPAGGISPSECLLQPDDGGCASPIPALCRAGRPWLRNLFADRARFPRPCEIPSRLPPPSVSGSGCRRHKTG